MSFFFSYEAIMHKLTLSCRWCLTLLLSLTMSLLVQAQANAAFSVTDSASPASIQAGQTEQLTIKVTTVYNHTNWSITGSLTLNGAPVASQNYKGLTLTGGVPLTENWSWQLPATAAPGTYTFTGQVFDEFGGLLKTAQANFSVTAASVNGQCGSANGA